MVRYNTLLITADNKSLILDVSVPEIDYYKDVYIDKIEIDTHETFIEGGPSKNPVFSTTIGTPLKNVKLTLTEDDLKVPINGNMFFIYAHTTGEPTDDIPSSLRGLSNIGTVVNLFPIYKEAMNHVREIDGKCTIPKDFIDFILRIKAIDMAIRTSNYVEAIKYWNKLFKRFCDSKQYINCEYYGKNTCNIC